MLKIFGVVDINKLLSGILPKLKLIVEMLFFYNYFWNKELSKKKGKTLTYKHHFYSACVYARIFSPDKGTVGS